MYQLRNEYDHYWEQLSDDGVHIIDDLFDGCHKLGYDGDNCCVLTLAAVTGWAYDKAYYHCKEYGRMFDDGMTDEQIHNMLIGLDVYGYNATPISNPYSPTCGENLKEFIDAHKKGVWFVLVDEHVLCVNNSVVYDEELDLNYRIYNAYKIEKVEA